MDTKTAQRNYLRKLHEACSHQTETKETSVVQVNAATRYLDHAPRRRKPAFGLMLTSRHLSKLPLSKPVLQLEYKP